MKVLIACIYLLCGGSVFGKTAIRSLIDASIALNSDAFWFTGDDDQPKGGYLLRFFLDIDGDGDKEMFVSLNGAERKGASWVVFKQDADGKLQKLVESIFIGADLRVHNINGINN